jgi:hypothetical protein
VIAPRAAGGGQLKHQQVSVFREPERRRSRRDVRVHPREALLDFLLGEVLERGDSPQPQALHVRCEALDGLDPDHVQRDLAQAGPCQLRLNLRERREHRRLHRGRAREVAEPGPLGQPVTEGAAEQHPAAGTQHPADLAGGGLPVRHVLPDQEQQHDVRARVRQRDRACRALQVGHRGVRGVRQGGLPHPGGRLHPVDRTPKGLGERRGEPAGTGTQVEYGQRTPGRGVPGERRHPRRRYLSWQRPPLRIDAALVSVVVDRVQHVPPLDVRPVPPYPRVPQPSQHNGDPCATNTHWRGFVAHGSPKAAARGG